MSAIEFTAQAGKTFSVQLYNVEGGAIGSPVANVTDTTTPTLYRADVGATTGIVYVVATATNLRVAGYANLDAPGFTGFSALADSVELAIKAKTDSYPVVILPGRDRALTRASRSQIIVYLGELVTVTRQVVDANSNPVNLAGRSLQFVIQDARGMDVAVVPSSAITISGAANDTYSFAVPTAASARVGTYEYSLNDLGTSKALLAEGDWLVRQRAVADAG